MQAAVVDAALIDGHMPVSWKVDPASIAAVVDAALIDGHCAYDAKIDGDNDAAVVDAALIDGHPLLVDTLQAASVPQ